MSSAYGHRIERGLFRWALVNTGPGTSECRRIAVQAAQSPHWKDPKRLVWNPYCKGHQCEMQPEFTASYRYVTGRAGRTTVRELHYCAEHAENFAKKNNLPMPAAQEGTERPAATAHSTAIGSSR